MPQTTPAMRPVWLDEEVEAGFAAFVEVALDEAEVAGRAATTPFSRDEVVAGVLNGVGCGVDVENVLPVVVE